MEPNNFLPPQPQPREIIDCFIKYLGWQHYKTFADIQGMHRDIIPECNENFFDPVHNWNDWRIVEERIIKDYSLWNDFIKNFKVDGLSQIGCYMQTPLYSRCLALYKLLQTQNDPSS